VKAIISQYPSLLNENLNHFGVTPLILATPKTLSEKCEELFQLVMKRTK
jgi:hypothetical protein